MKYFAVSGWTTLALFFASAVYAGENPEQNSKHRAPPRLLHWKPVPLRLTVTRALSRVGVAIHSPGSA